MNLRGNKGSELLSYGEELEGRKGRVIVIVFYFKSFKILKKISLFEPTKKAIVITHTL